MSDKFLKLTNTVYKVLEFFPESDPLKNRAKDKALAIMEHLVLINETSGWLSFQKEKIKVHLLEDIDMLLGYLWIGKTQGWLNSSNCLIIFNEYEKIKKEIGQVITLKIEPVGKLLTAEEQPILQQSPPSLNAPDGQSAQIVPEPVLEEAGTNLPEKAGKEGAPALFSKIKNISERQKKILEFLKKNEKAQVMDLQTILKDVTKRTIRRDLDELLEMGRIVRMGDFNQVFYKLDDGSSSLDVRTA